VGEDIFYDVLVTIGIDDRESSLAKGVLEIYFFSLEAEHYIFGEILLKTILY